MNFIRLLLIIIVSVLFYWRTLKYGYVSDDIAASKRPMPVKNIDKFWARFTGAAFNNPKIEHFTSLILHTIVCCLIFLAFGRNDISFFAALLFCINPVNTQAGVWLSGRAYAVITILCLSGFVFPIIFIPLYLYGIWGWSISGLLTPLAFLPTKYFYLSAALIIPIVFYNIFVGKHISAKLHTATTRMKTFSPSKIVLFIKTVSYYFVLCLFPVRLGMYHTFMYSYGVSKPDSDFWIEFDAHFWMGAALLITIGIAIIINWGNIIGFGLWWWLINIIMWCNLITMQQAIAERYVYLGNVGLMLALSGAILGVR